MKKNVLLLMLLVILAAILLPILMGAIGAVSGLAQGLFTGIGAALLTTFITIVALAGSGFLVLGIIGLVGVVFLAIALPFLAPLCIALIPVVVVVQLLKK